MERLYCLDFGLLHNIETKQMKEEKMSPLKDADNVYVKQKQMKEKKIPLKDADNVYVKQKQMKEKKMSPLKDADNVYVKYLVVGETLMVRTVLSSSFIRCKTFSHQNQH